MGNPGVHAGEDVINYPYLALFAVYLLVILAIGIWGWRRIDSQGDFATASQTISLPFVTASLLATYISALTIIGGVGYASTHGWAFITYFSAGVIAGSAFLSLSAKKWHQTGANTVAELITMRYNSRGLRALTAIIIVFSFVVILIAQLFGIGYILEGTIGVPMPVAILLVGLFITCYTILGGMVSVVRTDFIQVCVMGIGLLLMLGGVLAILWGDSGHSFTENAAHMSVYAGATSTNVGMASQFLALGLGTAVHPYFVQRVLSAEDVSTARMAPALTALGAFLIYLSICVIGIVGAIYLPEQVGDGMAPAIITELLPGVLGAIVLLALIAVVQSTTDSILHVIGVYLSQDIVGQYALDRPSSAELLGWSRRFTAVFGVAAVGFATYQAMAGELTLLAVIATYAWEVIGGSLFVVVAAGLLWRRATREGAIAAVTVGFGTVFGGNFLAETGSLPVDAIVLALVLSTVSMVVVSLLTPPSETDHLASVFEDAAAGHAD